MRREERGKVLDRRGIRLAAPDPDDASEPPSEGGWDAPDLDDFEPGTQL